MLGKVLAGRYRVTKHLGGGGFGRTYVAEDLHLPGKPPVIIKHLKPMSSMQEVLEMARDLFEREAKVLYRLGRHDQIPTLLAHFEEDEEFFLAQEYIHGHTLNQEIQRGKKQSEAYVINFLHQLLPVLEFVHSQQVIHRDIKPSNIIRRKSDGKLVLIDFGAVKEVSTQSLQEQSFTKSGLAIGSPGYMPNEQYGGKAQYASDIYAVGVTCIQALTGISPRDLPEDEATNEIAWRHLAQVSAPLANLLDKMVRFDFRQRYRSVAEVMADLAKISVSPSRETSKPAKKPISVKTVEPAPSLATLETLPLTQIVENLMGIEDQLRLKKLMFLVCTGILENDPNRLAGYELQDLVLSIHEISPSPEYLKVQLFNAVQTIAPRKQSQYLALAKSLYRALLPLYGICSPEEQAASALESDLQQLRVKKLLLYVCRQTWENDLGKLQSIKIADLLGELRQIAPSLSQLKSLLEESVKATTKPNEYMAIADLIVERLSMSYHPEPPPVTDSLEEAEPSLPQQSVLSSELFDVRLELMRYCNPLRLKMLLYVATSSNTIDWTELKTHDLNSLLRSLLHSCPDLPTLHHHLRQALTHLQPENIYQQISNQLLRVLKPMYERH
jgi:serine/threonine protein kinase